MPQKFWAEVVYTTIYLLSRSLTHAVKKMTLEEAWSRRKPKISHLRVFGSITYAWIPDAKRTKLDSKRQKLMLIGYSDNHKACWLIDVDIDCLTFSRDVVYDEEAGPFLLSVIDVNLYA